MAAGAFNIRPRSDRGKDDNEMPRRVPETLRDPDKLRAAVDSYLAEIAASVGDRDLKTGGLQPWQARTPSVVGLAVYLGVSKETLLRYMSNDIPDDIDIETRQSICDELSRARSRIEAATLEAAGAGRVDSRIASLILSGYGYGQRVEVDSTARVTVAGATADDVGSWSE